MLFRSEFLHWVDRVDARTVMANPPPILRWNVDKHYLRDLQAAGLPCVPTCFAEPGPDDDWREELRVLLEKGPVVVKPAISAGSNDTERHDAFAGARAHVSSLLALGRSTMIQPYVRRVDVDDETGLVFLGGRFSHAFAKGALLTDTKDVAGGLFARERIEPRIADGSQLDIGRRAMGWLTSRFGDVLYARIDLLPGDSGPMIVEAELTEPSLFLGTDPSAAANAARAIADALNESSGGRSR